MSSWPQFQDPAWLLLLLLVPFLLFLHHRRQAFGSLVYSSLPAVAKGRWRLHLPFYFKLGALTLLVVALARPQEGLAREESLTEGIDIQVILDISGSMAAEDFQPRNRLAVAKEVVQDFVEKRMSDRLGLVVFAGAALTKSPLTTDRRMLRTLIDSVELNTLPDGTAIGLALATAASRLEKSEAKTRIAVLVTDGVNNAGAVDPGTAAAICEGLEIKVYTIGVGTEGKVPVPVRVRNPRTGQVRVERTMRDVEVDEELLRKIADRTGGRFFQADDPEALRAIFAEIDELEKTPIQIKRYMRYREVFQPLVWGALALLGAPLLLTLVGVTAEP